MSKKIIEIRDIRVGSPKCNPTAKFVYANLYINGELVTSATLDYVTKRAKQAAKE